MKMVTLAGRSGNYQMICKSTKNCRVTPEGGTKENSFLVPTAEVLTEITVDSPTKVSPISTEPSLSNGFTRPLFSAMVSCGQGGEPGKNSIKFHKFRFFLDQPSWNLEQYAINVQDAVRGSTHLSYFGDITLEDRGDHWLFTFQAAAG